MRFTGNSSVIRYEQRRLEHDTDVLVWETGWGPEAVAVRLSWPVTSMILNRCVLGANKKETIRAVLAKLIHISAFSPRWVGPLFLMTLLPSRLYMIIITQLTTGLRTSTLNSFLCSNFRFVHLGWYNIEGFALLLQQREEIYYIPQFLRLSYDWFQLLSWPRPSAFRISLALPLILRMTISTLGIWR